MEVNVEKNAYIMSLIQAFSKKSKKKNFFFQDTSVFTYFLVISLKELLRYDQFFNYDLLFA